MFGERVDRDRDLAISGRSTGLASTAKKRLVAMLAATILAALVSGGVRWIGGHATLLLLTCGVYGLLLGYTVAALTVLGLKSVPADLHTVRSTIAIAGSGGLYGAMLCAFFVGIGGGTEFDDDFSNFSFTLAFRVLGGLMAASVLIVTALAVAGGLLAAPLALLATRFTLATGGRGSPALVACLAGGAVGSLAWPVIDPDTLSKSATVILFVVLPGAIGGSAPALLLLLAGGNERDQAVSTDEPGFP